MKCFLGLSSERAYKRYYPAIDPLISWSRYLDQLKDLFTRITGLYKNLNYAPDCSREYEDYEKQIRDLAATARVSGS